jgi:hypothetical protein
MSSIELLQTGASLVAIAGSVAAVALFVWRWRLSSIQSHYRDLALIWTNEGLIGSREPLFIHLALKLERGELFGSLTSPSFKERYSVYVWPGWFASKADISLQNRPIMRTTLILKGNRNRLYWRVNKINVPSLLPNKTVLWPSVLSERLDI